MEDQPEINKQNARQLSTDISEEPTPPVDKKYGYFPVVIIAIIFLLAVLIAFYSGSMRRKAVSSGRKLPTMTPQPTARSPIVSVANKIALVKNGDIYLADYNGENMTKVFETEQEELGLVQSEGLYMKFSPDGKYLAYLGNSGGLDSAIKVIDLNQKKKISQDVYGSAYISDFAWSPDSKKIAVAVNLKNNEQDFTTSIYLVDPFVEDMPVDLFFEPENIEITQVEWPAMKYLYYSRLSYDEDSFEMAGVVSIDMETKGRKVKDLIAWEASSFWFAISPEKDKIFFYGYPDFAPKRDPFGEILLLPSLEVRPSKAKVNFMGDPLKVKWIDNYLVGIIWPYGSPDQHVTLYDLDDNQVQWPHLLNMGPSGSFHSINLVEQDEKIILIVWSEFDGKHSVSAYDFEQLLEMKKKSFTSEPLWKLTPAASPNL